MTYIVLKAPLNSNQPTNHLREDSWWLTMGEGQVLWGRWTQIRLWRYGGWIVGRTLQVSDRSLYSMPSVILSQWRERRMAVIWQDLQALATVRARELWISWRRDNWDLEFIVKTITVIKFGVDDRGSNGTGSWWIEVRPNTAKLTNVIVTGFGEICNLVREGKM